MCGIFAIGSSPGEFSAVKSADDISKRIAAFADKAAALVSCDPGTARAGLLRKRTSDLRQALYPLLRPSVAVFLARNHASAEELKHLTGRIEQWRLTVENAIERSPGGKRTETLNQAVVACADTVWQIREDLLGNLQRTKALVPGRKQGTALLHAWHLNAALNSLNRLEVRGRDSAGLCVYLNFPDPKEREDFLKSAPCDSALRERLPGTAFGDGAVVAPQFDPTGLIFVYKLAEEVGAMGENVEALRRKITADPVLQAAMRRSGTRLLVLSHTRWASNGTISEANCHPVDSTILIGGAVPRFSVGRVIAALNGDVDNFQELKRSLEAEGWKIPPEVTTDAKIIPVLLARLLEKGRTPVEAFTELVEKLEGSFAVACLIADRPGEIFCAQKGSGQGLFLGFAGNTLCIASEVYGLVELTDRHIKAEGERARGDRVTGEAFRLSFDAPEPKVCILTEEGPLNIPATRIKTAEITTRDIHRGSYPHYLLKEINESVQSVRKTFRGRLARSQAGCSVRLEPSVLDPQLKKDLREGRLRRITVVGQGTAAVASKGIAYLLSRALNGIPVVVDAIPATELSANSLGPDMSDTLIIAVSQSGTTTDTNRTVDLVRARGARVIAIVNRRNSDLVYKAHSVLYTSDGRDIEMSVASTKAFYAQVAAGQLLALGLAEAAGTLKARALRAEAEALAKLPAVLERTLRLAPVVEALARSYAPQRRYWAVVGSGPGKIAADEIRIKLSELCYKAIAVDFLEDKKHIDLSSEPLVLVCAVGLSETQLGDAVKEAAIFKAHNALPIVITEEGEERFDPYAVGTVPVPRYEGALQFLLPVMIGHLFGYYAARAFEDLAVKLRVLRREVVRTADSLGGDGLTADRSVLEENSSLMKACLELRNLLRMGAFDSALEAGSAVSLAQVLDLLAGRLALDMLPEYFGAPGTCANCLGVAQQVLTEAINHVSRPIDAIKHQAKTVTVGISRLEEVAYEGCLWELAERWGLAKELVPTSWANFLSAFGRIVERIQGATLYEVKGLSPLGGLTSRSRIRLKKAEGAAARIPSRCARERPLFGTKRQVVQERQPFLGFGRHDGRPILIVPFVGSSEQGALLIVHLVLKKFGPRAERLAVLRSDRNRYNTLVAAVTEHDLPWSEELIDVVDNEVLFLRPPEEAATEMVQRIGARS